MKTFLALLFFLSLSTTLFAQVNPNSTYVDGYTRSDGTYVKGHYRTTPNSTINDNYSTYPNVNPYTGKQGTIEPEYEYDAPSYNSSETYEYEEDDYDYENEDNDSYFDSF